MASSHFVFEVKGCKNVWLLLHKSKGDRSKVYQFGLDIGSRSLITKWEHDSKPRNMIVDKYNNTKVLDCARYVKFWIAWENQDIKAGLGDTLYSGVIMHYNDSGPETEFNYLALGAKNDSWKIRY